MRYIVLLILNIPIISLALLNFVTRYKLGKIDNVRFRRQIVLWLVLLVAIISSFPLYNLLTGRAILDSSGLSFFDIIQTTMIILLLYIVNNQRQKTERIERNFQDLHQELSIKLSESANESKNS